jgi:hypothetical protein
MIPVTIELDRVRHIRYPWRSIVDAEKVAKKGLLHILMSASVESIILLLWAGLVTEDPKLTLEQTGDLLEEYLSAGKSLEGIEEAIHEGLKTGGWLKERPEPKAGG